MSKSFAIGQRALIVVLTVLIIVACAVGYLTSSSRILTSTVTQTISPVTSISTSVIATEITTVVSPLITTTTMAQPSNSFPTYSMTETSGSAFNSTLGLSLQLYAAPSGSIASLGRLDIMASVVNVRNLSNNVADENDWKYPATLLNPFDSCGSPGQVGLGIFQGNYASNNFSSGTALGLYNQSETFSCTTEAFPNAYLLFQPNGNFAQIVNPRGEMVENGSVSISDLVGGYWTSTYSPFPSGTYTIITADEWGQVVLLHFSVVALASTTSSTMTATTCSAGYVNGICGPITTTTSTLFDGASYCLGSNECSTLYPPSVADPNIENSSGGNLTFRFSSSNVKLQVVQTQGCVSTVPSCTHNDLAILLRTTPQCSESGNATLCTFVTDAIFLPSVSATGNYVEINLSYGLSANQTLGSETYYLAVK